MSFRYIDDLIIFNYDHDFLEISKDISRNTSFKKNENGKAADYLNLHISYGIYISIYNKHNFNFEVNQSVNWSSNIHKCVYINTRSQIFHHFKLCSRKN